MRKLATQALITKQFSKSGNKEDPLQEEEFLEIHEFATEPAVVRMSMGMTVNLGNYESAKVEVSLSVPCYREEIGEAYDFARSWVEDRALKEAGAARDFARSRGSKTEGDLF